MAKQISKKIADAMAKIEKDFGKGLIIKGSEKDKQINALSTGSFGLDRATGIGGYARGRIIEIYGPESSGKTTMCLTAIAQEHKVNPEAQCAVVDTEHSLDLNYAEALGVDLDRLFISQPENGEQALEITRRLINTGEFTVVIVDSVAALTPKDEMEGEIGDNKLGKHSRLMSQAMRILTGEVEHNNVVLIFTNQIREKIGVMFGNPETTTGGNALKFYASMRFDIRKIASIKGKDTEEFESNKVRVKVVKNKLAAPFRTTEFEIVFGKGINRTQELLGEAVRLDIVKKAGSWYSYKDDKIGQGEVAAVALLADNEELLAEIEKEIKLKYENQSEVSAPESEVA